MFEANKAPISNAAECDIEAMIDAVIDELDHPQNLFDQMLQSFAARLVPQETPKQAIEQILIFSGRLTEHLTLMKFEIEYL